jgi:PTS system ascorbate-specific IIB component
MAGMGSSMMLKIKCDQVIKEHELPIRTQHGGLDAIDTFDGDLIITMVDLSSKIQSDDPNAPYVAGILNIVDKDEIYAALEAFLATKQG